MKVCALLTSRSQCRCSDTHITIKAHVPFISWYLKNWVFHYFRTLILLQKHSWTWGLPQSHIDVFPKKLLIYLIVYQARNLLAALDYYQNVDRKPVRNKDGTLLYRSCTFAFNTLAYSCLIQGTNLKSIFFLFDLVTKHFSVDILLILTFSLKLGLLQSIFCWY